MKRWALVLLALSSCGGTEDAVPGVCKAAEDPLPIATAKLIIEFNATDDDIGVHGMFDDQGWSELCVLDPGGELIMVFDPEGTLNDLTMGGVFFESREPPSDEFSLDELKAAFPAGQYTVRAASFDETMLEGAATFTHDVPAPPAIRAPALAEDPDQPGPPISTTKAVVEWDAVTETVDGRPVTISGYEVIVTKEKYDDPNGFSHPVYDVHLPPSRLATSVPAEFLEPDTVYELEVLALETSGNQTITVGFFITE